MTVFMALVHRIVEKPDLKPNCKSLVMKNSFQVIKMDHSRTFLIEDARASTIVCREGWIFRALRNRLNSGISQCSWHEAMSQQCCKQTSKKLMQ